jgi:thymidine phosphorylase
MILLPQENIRHKRVGKALNKQEIDFFIKKIPKNSVKESQITVF